jgi:hypothetical protein
VAKVLNDCFGLPVTSGAVDVLEGRQRYHPLESPEFAGGAVTIPGGDAAQQDALNGASVKLCEGLRGQAKFLSAF